MKHVIFVLCVVALMGCASTDPCPPPKVETVTVTTPQPCIYEIMILEGLILPTWPAFPGIDAGEEKIKEWLADVKSTVDLREVKMQARIQALEYLIKKHNEQGPKCVDIE